ncbi:hypothetical protein AVEN_179543-1 [Araneus ventricosus]|uniref:Uncharacterized protein n=1 Tax=Araneus ventricosus TaxID=182803 RepID=A0A4Y2G5Z2_ARAVE|nr:hypothetical protein AVEN_65830-1 [Araneus ventricosus]GBM48657.1 hypothetical protein AVEN_179543-1 [Araneus ventricosus]
MSTLSIIDDWRGRLLQMMDEVFIQFKEEGTRCMQKRKAVVTGLPSHSLEDGIRRFDVVRPDEPFYWMWLLLVSNLSGTRELLSCTQDSQTTYQAGSKQV